MAKKSKTQKAKASARRAEKKLAAQNAHEAGENVTTASSDDSASTKKADTKSSATKTADSKSVKSATAKSASAKASTPKSSSKKEAKKAPKKKSGIARFYSDVKAEMKRVTWPSRQDVAQWSGVVVVALLFFGIYVAILDSAIITPLLVAYSGLSIG